jgi:hypothetical protein
MQNRALRVLTTNIIGRLSTYTGKPYFFHDQELKQKKKTLVDACIVTLRKSLADLNGVDATSDVSTEQAKIYLKKLEESLLSLQESEAYEEQQKNINHISFQQNREKKQTLWSAFFNSTLRQSTVRKLTEKCFDDLQDFACNHCLVDPIALDPTGTLNFGEGQKYGM